MATFDVINPATSAVLDRAPDATADDARQAVEQSVAAFAGWKAKTAFERSAVLRKWYELILKDEDTLARLMTQEMGKPITESRGEVKYAAGFVEWYAEEAKRAYGDIVPSHAAQQAAAGDAPAGGSRLRGDAVEFSRGDGHAQGRARAGRRMHGGAEARRAVAADGDSSCRAVGAGRRTGRCIPGADDVGSGCGVGRVLRRRARAQARRSPAAPKSGSRCTRRPRAP